MQYNGDILIGGVSMRPQGSPKFLEERRRRAVAFLKQQLSLHEIARRIGCHASSVLRWRNAMRSGGQDALKAKPTPGRPPRLTPKQKKQVVRLLAKGALAHGPDRVVDHTTNCRGDRTSSSSEIPSQSRGQAPAPDGLEPPEAGTSGP